MAFREVNSVWDAVVVGAGPAGCSAAVQLKRLGLKVVLLEKGNKPGGLAVNARRIENYAGLIRPISGREYAERLGEFIGRFQVPFRRAEVQSLELDLSERGGAPIVSIKAEGGGVLRARTAVLAVGTVPNRLEIPGLGELVGRRAFYHIAEARVREGESVAIVGGGEAAFDYALSAADAGARVWLLIRGKKPRASGDLAREVFDNSKIEVLFNTVVESCQRFGETPNLGGEPGLKIELREGGRKSIRHFDKILVAIGRTSALRRLLDGELRGYLEGEPSGLPVPLAHCQRPGVFICGDCRFGSLGQTATAAGDGLFAAKLVYEYLQSLSR